MNKRERVLAMAVGAILLLAAGQWVLNSVISGPLELKTNRLKALQSELEIKQAEWDESLRLQADLVRWSEQCLPEEVGAGQTDYPKYLRDLATSAGITGSEITYAPPNNLGGFQDPRTGQSQPSATILPFSITMRCDLKKLTRFMNGIYKAPLLHQIRRLTLKPRVEGGRLQDFDAVIRLEALSFHDAASKSLPIDPEEAAKSGKETPPAGLLLFAEKNPFQPTKLEPIVEFKPRPVVKTVPKERDERPDYMVTATTIDRGVGRVWLRHTSSKRETVYEAGDELKIGGLVAKVVDVQPPRVLLDVEGKVNSVRVGKDLTRMVEMPSPEVEKVAAKEDDHKKPDEVAPPQSPDAESSEAEDGVAENKVQQTEQEENNAPAGDDTTEKKDVVEESDSTKAVGVPEETKEASAVGAEDLKQSPEKSQKEPSNRLD